MALDSTIKAVRARLVTQMDDSQRKAMFAKMSGEGGIGSPVGSSGVGAPVGAAVAPRGTKAGRYVSSGGLTVKGKSFTAGKSSGIHVPSYKHPGKGSGSTVTKTPFKTQVAAKLGLTPTQLNQVLHAVKGKSPQRLAAGAKLHTKLARNAAQSGHALLAAQHRQAAAIHTAALKEHAAALKEQHAKARAAKKLTRAETPPKGYHPAR